MSRSRKYVPLEFEEENKKKKISKLKKNKKKYYGEYEECAK